MGSPRFVSPGAMAGSAIEDFLMKRALMEREQMEMEFRQRQAAESAQRQAAELALRQQAEARQAEQMRLTTERQGRLDDMAATEQRQQQNQVGLRQMLGDALTQQGDPIRGLAAMSGMSLPAEHDPEAELREYEGKRRIDAKYRVGDSSSEPLVAIMGPNGEPVLVPRAQAVGKRPASTREQGRPVMTGDANRIADLDTSLDDVDVLGKTLGNTGAQSAVGAALPNVVTELTGWGQDAKQRQATIDRVKQVIGKALEGGVLRKEDEAKYAAILPTIGDPPAVAQTKMQGLRDALTKRRQTFVDSLTDSGFDTSKHAARAGQRATPSKVITGAQIAAIAKKRNLSPDVVAAQAERQGYTVQ